MLGVMGLLKNRSKYKKLKQKYIDNLRSDFRINRSYKSPHFKLFYNGKYIYFKTQESEDLRYNELICNEIAKRMKINCVEYDLAELKHDNITYKGLVSNNFVNNNQSFVACATYSFGANDGLCGIIRNLEKFKKQNECNLDTEEIEFDLFKMIVFDYLTCQSDRHDCNFGFILDNNGDIPTLKVAPLFDNELSFGFTSIKNFEDIFSIINLNLRFAPYNFNILNNNCIIGCENNELAREIILYAKDKPQLLDYVKFVIRDFNTINLGKSLQKKVVYIPNQKLQLVDNIIGIKKRELLQTYINILTPKRDKKNTYKIDKNTKKYTLE